jgi:hypothetical protein
VRRHHLEAFDLEDEPEHLAEAAVVVDDEDA